MHNVVQHLISNPLGNQLSVGDNMETLVLCRSFLQIMPYFHLEELIIDNQRRLACSLRNYHFYRFNIFLCTEEIFFCRV